MILYTNGDSWSWDLNLQSDNLWTNILSKKINADCINESVGCGSNSRIVDCLRNQLIQGLQPDLIVIALTSHHRCHVPAPDFGVWNIGVDVALNDQTGNKNTEIVKWVFTHSYQEIDSVYRYYRDVWTIDLLCKYFSCPYLLIQAWEKQFEELKLLESSENISKYVYSQCGPESGSAKKYITYFERIKQLSKNWNYIEIPLSNSLNQQLDIDRTGHPNPHGHHKIADKIYQYLQESKVI